MANRVFNFSAGPATMPLEVLKRVQSELLDYRGIGASIMEISHRSKTFEAVAQSAEARFRRLTGLKDDYAILFLHGGATQQFSVVPMNFYQKGRPVDIIHSGHWTERAMKEMKPIAEFRIAASSEDKKFRELPEVSNALLSKNASYVHYCSNNTIFGTQWTHFTRLDEVPAVVDMSSDILSRKFPYEQFDLFYAGAQKNIGPSGLCIVGVRKTWIEKGREDIPPFFQYRHQLNAQSLYNTPNTFAIYMADLVFEWLENQGGVPGIEKINQAKSDLLYEFIDASKIFQCPVKKEHRSKMNVVFDFQSPNDELNKKFLAGAESAGLMGLKGHRIAGGFRASIYNALSFEGVEALVKFMRGFEKTA